MRWYKKQDMTMHRTGNDEYLKLDLASSTLDVLENRKCTCQVTQGVIHELVYMRISIILLNFNTTNGFRDPLNLFTVLKSTKM